MRIPSRQYDTDSRYNRTTWKTNSKCNLDNRAQDKILENELEMQSWKTNSRYNFEKRTHKTNFRYKTSIAGDSGHAPFIGDR